MKLNHVKKHLVRWPHLCSATKNWAHPSWSRTVADRRGRRARGLRGRSKLLLLLFQQFWKTFIFFIFYWRPDILCFGLLFIFYFIWGVWKPCLEITLGQPCCFKRLLTVNSFLLSTSSQSLVLPVFSFQIVLPVSVQVDAKVRYAFPCDPSCFSQIVPLSITHDKTIMLVLQLHDETLQ